MQKPLRVVKAPLVLCASKFGQASAPHFPADTACRACIPAVLEAVSIGRVHYKSQLKSFVHERLQARAPERNNCCRVPWCDLGAAIIKRILVKPCACKRFDHFIVHTAGIISLLTHTCISVGLHIVVHLRLTHAHQSSYHWGLHTNAASPAVVIPAILSQIQILSQA